MSSEPAIRSRGPAPSNVDVAVAAVRDAIVSGRLAPGARIKEIPLSEQIGVSRGPVRDALRLLELDGLVQLVPNRGAIVPEVRAADLLEVYALRASLGSLALRKLMLEDAATLPVAALERELARLEKAAARGRAKVAIDADLAYQATLVDAAALPRVSREFERLTWQVRIFAGSTAFDVAATLPRITEEVGALHAAVLAYDLRAAERLWRAKFERWIRDMIEVLEEDFDDELWAAITTGR